MYTIPSSFACLRILPPVNSWLVDRSRNLHVYLLPRSMSSSESMAGARQESEDLPSGVLSES